MKTKSLISVIIPLYNESGNIDELCEELILELNKISRPYEVIFIDDGSTDDTTDRLTTYARNNTQLKILRFKRNVGQTAAMMAGIDNATGDIFIPMDGDLQSDPAEIKNLLAKLDEGFDVVSGWRKNRQDSFWSRVLPSRIANTIISFVSGVSLKDFGCTQKAYRREVLEGFRLYGEMHRFVPIYADWQGAKITEIPVNHRERLAGESKYGASRVFKVILDLIVVKFLTQYESKPIYIFGMVGFSFFGVSFLAGFYALYLKYFKAIPFVETPLPLLFTLGFITAVMCILLGLLAEIMIRVYFESQGKLQYAIRKRINIDDKS